MGLVYTHWFADIGASLRLLSFYNEEETVVYLLDKSIFGLSFLVLNCVFLNVC